MSVVALGSAKGAPGVTTAAVALAMALPSERQVVVVEADPHGGDLAARLGLPVDAGLAALAAATRRGGDPGGVLSRAPCLHRTVTIVPGPGAAEQAGAALGVAAELGSALANASRDVLFDCGRLVPDSPALPLLHAADAVVLVARPSVDEVSHLLPRTQALVADGHTVAVVLAGSGPYSPGEVASVLDVPVLGSLPHDPSGVNAVCAGAPDKVLHRSPFWRGARDLSRALSDFLGTSPAAQAARGAAAAHLVEQVAEAERALAAAQRDADACTPAVTGGNGNGEVRSDHLAPDAAHPSPDGWPSRAPRDLPGEPRVDHPPDDAHAFAPAQKDPTP